MPGFKRVLVANRGEISVRVIRALKTLNLESVAVYSDADAAAMHVSMADSAYNLSGVSPADTYLNSNKIIEAARSSDSDAIHPGYGFLSESADFSRLCRENSIKFVGPRPETLEISGNKLECKKLVESKGVPVIPYSREPLQDPDAAANLASEIGFPVLLKSAFGGGGRGIREAKSKKEVKESFESAQREAKTAFGRFSLFIEKKLVHPRHIEIQVVASDDSKEFVHLGERECSIQRRYQKLVELSPSPVVDEEARKLISSHAITAARAVKYSNAGTVEFLRDSATGKFYFIEINSRLQVEHPVSESVTGVDLVATQLHIASRVSIPFAQKDVRFRGAAIECRINAEDPANGFAPTVGTIDYLKVPGGPGIRVDTALRQGLEIPPYYDSLIAKLISYGQDFDEARRRALVALQEFAVSGIQTTIPLYRAIMQDENFVHGNFDTGYFEKSGIISKLSRQSAGEEDYLIAALLLSRGGSARQGSDSRKVRSAPWTRSGQERFVDAI